MPHDAILGSSSRAWPVVVVGACGGDRWPGSLSGRASCAEAAEPVLASEGFPRARGAPTLTGTGPGVSWSLERASRESRSVFRPRVSLVWCVGIPQRHSHGDARRAGVEPGSHVTGPGKFQDLWRWRLEGPCADPGRVQGVRAHAQLLSRGKSLRPRKSCCHFPKGPPAPRS